MSVEYVVERIDRKKDIDGTPFYFIKWKGWAETFNTWEPLENLDGCPNLLKEFEKRHAKSSKRSARRGGGGKNINEQDETEDVDQALAETAEHMKSYGILVKWPADKEPLSVEGVIHVDGQLTYVVKRKTTQRSTGLTRSNANLVYAENFRLQYPHLVIKFYESRVLWSDNAKSEEGQANTAAQNTLLHQNLGSHRGKIIANDIDCKLRELYDERKEMNKRVEQEATGIEDHAIEDDEALEEEEVLETDEKSDEDNFGLPNNLDHVSSDDDATNTSGSESELEEIDVDNKMDGWSWKRPTKTASQVASDDEEEKWNWKRLPKTANLAKNENDDGGIGMSDY